MRRDISRIAHCVSAHGYYDLEKIKEGGKWYHLVCVTRAGGKELTDFSFLDEIVKLLTLPPNCAIHSDLPLLNAKKELEEEYDNILTISSATSHTYPIGTFLIPARYLRIEDGVVYHGIFALNSLEVPEDFPPCVRAARVLFGEERDEMILLDKFREDQISWVKERGKLNIERIRNSLKKIDNPEVFDFALYKDIPAEEVRERIQTICQDDYVQVLLKRLQDPSPLDPIVSAAE